MTSQKPLVTVLVACYQQEHLIAATLESILGQTYDHIEIVVGDDASTDKTASIVEAYVTRYPSKLRLLRSERNLGITGNCRRLAPHIRGRYVCWFSGDDLMHPEKIARQVSLLESNPSAVLCYHDCDVFDEAGGKTLYHYNGPGGHPVFEGDVVEALLVHRCFMCAISVMQRVSAMPANGFDIRVPTGSDWLFFIETAVQGEVFYLPDVMARYRRHTGNVTARWPSYRDEAETYRIVSERYPRFASAVECGQARMYLFYAIKFLLLGAVGESIGALTRLFGVLIHRPSVMGSLFAGVLEEVARQHVLRHSSRVRP